MNPWTPATKAEVEALFEEALASLPHSLRLRFKAIAIPPRAIPIQDSPGEVVFVIAEHEGKILYWSDVEDGWEFEAPNERGGIDCRGCNQFELSHVAHQIFGEPDAH